MALRIERLVTAGTFSLDGGTWDVDNNVWFVGNDEECIVIDAPHDPAAILDQLGGRQLLAVLLTHAHNDHIGAVQRLAQETGAPVHLHPADRMLWDAVYPDAGPDREVHDGDTFAVAGSALRALHTPGHSPGSVCYYLESEGTVFTGDTLFQGGPGATGRSYSDYPTILASIGSRLMTLPPETVVRTGHGESTTIAAEAAGIAEAAAH
ncbi:MBL fold metallo-hydrolase [Pseudarthrobacter sp. P1]|uniref:MBL fold metallo-hydrolase n=1 Tax=Pseudarthrobacter sp. P1 TaxID=3418418 RepID=UPI003CED3746